MICPLRFVVSMLYAYIRNQVFAKNLVSMSAVGGFHNA